MDQTDLNQKVHSLHSPNNMNLRDVSRSCNGTNSSRKGLNLGLLFCTETISIYNSQPQHLLHSRSLHRYLEFLLTDIRLPSQSRSGKGRSSANTVYQCHGKLHCSAIQLAFKIICSSVFSLLHLIQQLRENHRQISHLTSCFDNKHHRSCFSNSSIIQTNKMLYMQGCHDSKDATCMSSKETWVSQGKLSKSCYSLRSISN